jgi:hypothetical protein
MKFIVASYGEQPLGSVVEEHWCIHARTLATYEAFDAKFGEREGAWLSKGRNHRQHVHRHGQYLVEREELRPVSVLTIDTDDDLVKFLQDTGYVVRASDYADVPLAIGEERD